MLGQPLEGDGVEDDGGNLLVDRQHRQTVHGAPEGEAELGGVTRPDLPRALAIADRAGEQVPGGKGGLAERRMIAPPDRGPGHETIVRGVRGGEAYDLDRHRLEGADGIATMGPRGAAERAAERAETFLGDGGEERALVPEVPVGRRLRHPRAARGAAERHPERPVGLEQRRGRRDQRGAQVPVVVRPSPVARRGRRDPARHGVPPGREC